MVSKLHLGNLDFILPELKVVPHGEVPVKLRDKSAGTVTVLQASRLRTETVPGPRDPEVGHRDPGVGPTRGDLHLCSVHFCVCRLCFRKKKIRSINMVVRERYMK